MVEAWTLTGRHLKFPLALSQADFSWIPWCHQLEVATRQKSDFCAEPLHNLPNCLTSVTPSLSDS